MMVRLSPKYKVLIIITMNNGTFYNFEFVLDSACHSLIDE